MSLTDRVAFCLLSDVKDDLGVTDSSKDSALERRILAASSMLESYCSRRFRRAVNKVEKLAGYGTTRLIPSLAPISSVTELLLDGSPIASSAFEVEESDAGEGWCLYSESGWGWTTAAVSSYSGGVTPVVGEERRAFQLTYTAGYSLPNDTDQSGPALPPPIVEAAIALSCHLWRQKGRDLNITAETDGDASVTLGVVGDASESPAANLGIPGSIAAMVDPWRRVR